MKLGIYDIKKCNFEHMDDKIEFVYKGVTILEITYNARDNQLTLTQIASKINGTKVFRKTTGLTADIME